MRSHKVRQGINGEPREVVQDLVIFQDSGKFPGVIGEALRKNMIDHKVHEIHGPATIEALHFISAP